MVHNTLGGVEVGTEAEVMNTIPAAKMEDMTRVDEGLNNDQVTYSVRLSDPGSYHNQTDTV